MSDRTTVSFRLNGVATRASVTPTMSVLEMLRDELGLTGTKYGCGEGECGACSILADGAAVNACLMFAIDLGGRSLTTVEGLSADPVGAKLQQSFVDAGAVQCGFCTPGMIVQATDLLRREPGASRERIARGIEGNLCRCTGYVKIIDAIEACTNDAPERAAQED